MAKFRETLWFKKGELDAVAAHDPEGPGAADLLPIEDRYRDDGSVSGADTESFGVRSGQTQALDRMKATTRMEPVSAPPPQLVRELKRGRMAVIGALGMSLAVLAAALYVF
jgi:hypothetical protein